MAKPKDTKAPKAAKPKTPRARDPKAAPLAAAVMAEDITLAATTEEAVETREDWLRALGQNVHFFSADKQEAAAEAVEAIVEYCTRLTTEKSPDGWARIDVLRTLLEGEAELLAARVNQLCSKIAAPWAQVEPPDVA